MLTRKSGILALILGVGVLGACEDKDVVQPTPEPPEVVLNIAPDPVPALEVGQTVQLVAIVSGSTNQGASWTSSNTAVASVNASGLVEAEGVGVAVITAVSAADANARDAVTIQVVAGDGGGPVVGQPTITVQSITQGGTTQPVNPGNVQGEVDVTLNVDIPAGVQATAVRVMLAPGANQETGGTEVCRQSFSSSATVSEGVDAQQVPQIIVCSFNTAQLDANGNAVFTNGVYTLRGEVLNGTDVLARAIVSPLVLNNQDVIVATVSTERMAIGGGLAWRGGDVTVNLVPAIYSGTPNALASLSVTLTSPSGYVEGECDVTQDPDDVACDEVETTLNAEADEDGTGFTVVFPYDEALGDGGAGLVEDPNMELSATALTSAGNQFTGDVVFVFPVPAGSPAGVPPTEITALNPLRLDNLAPRVTFFDITPDRLGCDQANCYIGSDFEFDASDDDFFAFVDFGVNQETASFDVGTAAQFDAGTGFDADVESGSDPDLEESETPNLLVRANVEDALENERQVYATSDADVPTEDVDDADQFIGVDVTAPEITDVDSTTGAEDEGTDPFADDAAESWVISFQDESADAGPAGFGDEPLVINSVTLYNQDSPDGDDLDDGEYDVVCGATDCTLTIEDGEGDTEGYVVVDFAVVDAAFPGNVSAAQSIIWLDDETAPLVAGVTSPSTIVGGSTVTFTADMSDNVELGDILAAIGYAGDYYAHEEPRVINTYGVPLTDDSGNQGFTFPNFIYSIENTAAGAPDGAPAFADAVNFAVRDVAAVENGTVCAAPGADNVVVETCITRENNTIEPNVAAGNDLEAFDDIDADLETWILTQAEYDSDEDVEESTLEAEAVGPQGTFAAPFDFVNFYYFENGRWIRIEGTVSRRAVDDDTQNVRRWIYTLTTDIDVDGLDIRAVGVEDGAGLATETVVGTTI
jgi:hypothetical protein